MIDNTALQEAIAYFEDAVRESDEIIEDCSPDLQRDLTEQKEHFVVALEAMRRAEPANEPLTCEGCVEKGQYENEVEYGYPSPCTRCKRRSPDNYRRKPEPEGGAR